MLGERPRLYPGIEELVGRLDARPVRHLRVVISVPELELRADTHAQVQRGIRTYCDQRLAQTRATIEAQRREGLRALVLGIVLFTVGFLVAREISRSGLDDDVRSFLADGVFLVFAWVGLWYPLDALIYYPMRQRRDQRLLRILGAAEIDVSTSS